MGSTTLSKEAVIASEAKQSSLAAQRKSGSLRRFAPRNDGGETSGSAQLVQQHHQRLTLLGIERRQRFPGDRQRVGRGLFRQLLTGAGEADKQAAAVFRIGAGLGQ